METVGFPLELILRGILMVRLNAPVLVSRSEYDRRKTEGPQGERRANSVFREYDHLVDDPRRILRQR
jgi:hypothetical protein